MRNTLIANLISISMLLICVEGIIYDIIINNKELLGPCDRFQPWDQLIDLSNITIERRRGLFHIEGTGSMAMTNMKNIDTIELTMRTYTMKSGSWAPTLLTTTFRDVCKEAINSKGAFSNYFTEYVYQEDRRCPLRKGDVWRFHPFDVEPKLDLPTSSMEGNYKVEAIFVPKDKLGKRLIEYTTCFVLMIELSL